MKKKLISLALVLVLLCVLAIPAFANDGGANPTYYRGTEGSKASWFINERAGYNVRKVTSISGVLPDGMHTKINDGMLYVTGTPSRAGTFNANIHVRATDGDNTWDDQLPCVFTIEGGSHSDYTLPAYYATVQVGEYRKLSFDMDCSGSITDYSVRGNVPNGMSTSMDYYGVYVKGSPSTAGTYSFNLRAYDSYNRCNVTQPVTLTVKGASIPTVTKSPTSESVEEGGRALFVARASDANSITWYISKDGTTYSAGEAPYYFTGLTVSGTNAETLVLNNIPKSMDGWMTQAKFTGSAGSVYSGQARINVTSAYVAPPTIRTQPKSVTMAPGEVATLNVFATSSGNNGVGYTWVEAYGPDDYEGDVIDDEENSAITLEYEAGERYYYCEVFCYDNRNTSEIVCTDIVTVTGKEPDPAPTEPAATVPPETQPATVPETQPAPTAPAQTVPAETTAPAPAPTQPAAQDHTVAYIVGGVLVVAMICCTAVLITVLKKGKYGR